MRDQDCDQQEQPSYKKGMDRDLIRMTQLREDISLLSTLVNKNVGREANHLDMLKTKKAFLTFIIIKEIFMK